MKKIKKLLKITVIAVVIAALGCGGWVVYRSYQEEDAVVSFKTERINRQTIMRTISATGTVEPEELVNVGAQVSGKIMSFGKDTEGRTIDYGSKITTGMVLAQIDDVTYKAELQQCLASRQQAEAAIQSARAAIQQAEAKQQLAQREWERAQQLFPLGSMTKSDYDNYESGIRIANADISVAKAQLAQAEAQLSSAEAALVKARRNMEYCVITSPVDGIVIDRRVSIGQTVVSSQTASSIFLVATDFRKMQVWVSVNEADIGSIHKGMPVVFSVDAFPGVEFRGEVFRVRLNATLSSNVVTYIVEVNTDNADGKLLPYLTANVKFVRESRADVLSISNAALRFRPAPEWIDPAFERPESKDVVWVRTDNNLLRPVAVKAGINNGLRGEIVESELKEGDEVVTGAAYVSAAASVDSGEAKNPFMPNLPKAPARGSAGQRQRAEKRQAAQ